MSARPDTSTKSYHCAHCDKEVSTLQSTIPCTVCLLKICERCETNMMKHTSTAKQQKPNQTENSSSSSSTAGAAAGPPLLVAGQCPNWLVKGPLCVHCNLRTTTDSCWKCFHPVCSDPSFGCLTDHKCEA